MKWHTGHQSILYPSTHVAQEEDTRLSLDGQADQIRHRRVRTSRVARRVPSVLKYIILPSNYVAETSLFQQAVFLPAFSGVRRLAPVAKLVAESMFHLLDNALEFCTKEA